MAVAPGGRMDHPFRGLGAPLFLAVPFLLGFFAGLAAGLCLPAIVALLLLLALTVLVLRLPPLAAASCLMAMCGALAALRMPFVESREIDPFLGREVLMTATVESVSATGSGWSAVARDAVLSFPDGPGRVRVRRILLTVRCPETSVRFPAEVRAAGRVHPIRSRGNPLEIPREANALARRVQYRFSTDASRTVFLPPAPFAGPAPFPAARERIGRWLQTHAGTSHGAVFLRAVTTGETPPPGHPLVLLLRRTGLSHLLAISGLHAGIFFAGSALLLRCVLWLFRRRHGSPDLNRICLAASLPVCWGYILVAGAPVSGVRAAGMITAGVMMRRRLGIRSAGTAWALLFLGTIVAAPWQVCSPSFLLSYAATFFLIACACPETDPRGRGIRLRLQRALAGGLIASTVAFAGTLPISGALFGGVPAGAILWNLLFTGPLGAAGVAGAFLSAAAALIRVDAVGPLAGMLADGLTSLLELLARLSGDGAGYLPLPPAGVAVPILAVAGAAWGSVALCRRGRAAWPSPLAAAVAYLVWIHLPYAALPDPMLTVTALNVGKGASHLVSFPGGRFMLIDCGSRLRGDSGERILLPFLRSRGIRTVDILVLTHPHEDHFGGSEAVLRRLHVGEIWIPQGSSPGAFGKEVARLAGKVRIRRPGESARFGGAEVRVRASGAGGNGGKPNEGSLVLEVRYGALSVWFPGDVEGGPSVWGAFGPADPGTRILFLPHHGSPRAKPAAWIAAASPVAAVSQNSDCAVWDNLLPSCRFFALENGAVSVRSNGASVSIEQEGGGARLWSLLLRPRK